MDAVLKAVYQGTATRAWSVVGKASPFYDASLEKTFGGDAAKANALLDAAGWTAARRRGLPGQGRQAAHRAQRLRRAVRQGPPRRPRPGHPGPGQAERRDRLPGQDRRPGHGAEGRGRQRSTRSSRTRAATPTSGRRSTSSCRATARSTAPASPTPRWTSGSARRPPPPTRPSGRSSTPRSSGGGDREGDRVPDLRARRPDRRPEQRAAGSASTPAPARRAAPTTSGSARDQDDWARAGRHLGRRHRVLPRAAAGPGRHRGHPGRRRRRHPGDPGRRSSPSGGSTGPEVVQYLDYLWRLLHGDLGRSYQLAARGRRDPGHPGRADRSSSRSPAAAIGVVAGRGHRAGHRGPGPLAARRRLGGRAGVGLGAAVPHRDRAAVGVLLHARLVPGLRRGGAAGARPARARARPADRRRARPGAARRAGTGAGAAVRGHRQGARADRAGAGRPARAPARAAPGRHPGRAGSPARCSAAR